jgi:hypothetical protein
MQAALGASAEEIVLAIALFVVIDLLLSRLIPPGK